jgi:hypothetical protein
MSNYTVNILNDNETRFWNDFIEQSPYGTIFHKLEWLKAAEENSKSRFMPIGIKKGNHIVSILPLFLRKKYGVKLLMSPPDSCGIPHLGPVFRIPAANKYKQENTYLEVIDEIVRFAEVKIGFDYFRIVHPADIVDMRPYTWNRFTVRPVYTYKFDLSGGHEKIYNAFHKSTKNALNKASSSKDISISRDRKYAFEILSLVDKRYAEQNRKFRIGPEYFNALMSDSLKENIEPIAILHDNRVIAGDVTITDRKQAYAWIGSVSRDGEVRGVGELVLWEKLKEYAGRGFHSYDFVGANTRHICKHKSKYGADLVPYYEVHKTSHVGKMAINLLKLYEKR